MDQLISLGYGKVSFTRSSASLSAFVVTDGWVRNFPSKVFSKQGHTAKFDASNHPQVNGSVFLDSVHAPEGSVIVLQASHRVGGSAIRDGAIILRVRSTGPLLAIRAHLPNTLETRLPDGHLVFQGRGDLLDDDELDTYGLEPPKNWLTAFRDPEEVEECYEVTVVAAETVSAPVLEAVADRDGAVVMVQKKSRRRLNIR